MAGDGSSETAASTLGRGAAPAVIRALRLHQWVKNVLVVVPLVLAHRVSDREALLHALYAFVSFGLVASAGYVFNDLRDREADRLHPVKRDRPFASGELSAGAGVVLIVVLLAAGFVLASAVLPTPFTVALSTYLVTTVLYSWQLKRLAVVDVLVLAGLYTLRLFAGGLASEVPLSPWLLAFAMFLFLSLAVAKRYSELAGVAERSESRAVGRGYLTGDRELLTMIGVTAGYLAVLVLALYVNGPDVSALYSRPLLLLLICPVLLYWITRLWLLAHRGELHDDPVVFTLEDPLSYALGAVTAIILWIAI